MPTATSAGVFNAFAAIGLAAKWRAKQAVLEGPPAGGGGGGGAPGLHATLSVNGTTVIPDQLQSSPVPTAFSGAAFGARFSGPLNDNDYFLDDYRVTNNEVSATQFSYAFSDASLVPPFDGENGSGLVLDTLNQWLVVNTGGDDYLWESQGYAADIDLTYTFRVNLQADMFSAGGVTADFLDVFADGPTEGSDPTAGYFAVGVYYDLDAGLWYLYNNSGLNSSGAMSISADTWYSLSLRVWIV